MANNVTGKSTKQHNNGTPKGMAGGTNTKKSALMPGQQASGNFANGPGVPTSPQRGVPPKSAGRGKSHDGPGARGTPKGGTNPPLNVGKAKGRK